VGAIRVTHGYSRDHRPDLQQWVMNLVCADTGGIPPRFAPGDGNPSDREALVPLLARYRQALDLGAVVVLDGAGYRRENLRALAGFSWILRVSATLKEARAREEEEGLRRRVARAEGEAEKTLGKLLSRRFACEADARRALEEASGRLPHHRLVYLGVQEERRRGRVGRPRKGEAPLAVGHRLLARLGSWSGRGGAWGASSWPRTSWTGRPCRPEVLGRYKDQTRTVERGFRFLQGPPVLHRQHLPEAAGAGDGPGPFGLRPGGVGAAAGSGRDGVQPAGSEG